MHPAVEQGGPKLVGKSELVVELRRGGRVVECTGLENRRGFIAHREFESLLLRHFRQAS